MQIDGPKTFQETLYLKPFPSRSLSISTIAGIVKDYLAAQQILANQFTPFAPLEAKTPSAPDETPTEGSDPNETPTDPGDNSPAKENQKGRDLPEDLVQTGPREQKGNALKTANQPPSQNPSYRNLDSKNSIANQPKFIEPVPPSANSGKRVVLANRSEGHNFFFKMGQKENPETETAPIEKENNKEIPMTPLKEEESRPSFFDSLAIGSIPEEKNVDLDKEPPSDPFTDFLDAQESHSPPLSSDAFANSNGENAPETFFSLPESAEAKVPLSKDLSPLLAQSLPAAQPDPKNTPDGTAPETGSATSPAPLHLNQPNLSSNPHTPVPLEAQSSSSSLPSLLEGNPSAPLSPAEATHFIPTAMPSSLPNPVSSSPTGAKGASFARTPLAPPLPASPSSWLGMTSLPVRGSLPPNSLPGLPNINPFVSVLKEKDIISRKKKKKETEEVDEEEDPDQDDTTSSG